MQEEWAGVTTGITLTGSESIRLEGCVGAFLKRLRPVSSGGFSARGSVGNEVAPPWPFCKRTEIRSDLQHLDSGA